MHIKNFFKKWLGWARVEGCVEVFVSLSTGMHLLIVGVHFAPILAINMYSCVTAVPDESFDSNFGEAQHDS